MQKVSSCIKKLGAWVDMSANYGAQQAATDGFVQVHMTWNGSDSSTEYALGYTDVNSNPTTLRGSASTCRIGSSEGHNPYNSFTMPIKKGEYWKVTLTGSPTLFSVYWIPFK